jgi:hypothetical protein
MITSLSLEVESPTPRSSSSRRSCGALIRLPLWPDGERAVERLHHVYGWVLRSLGAPVVE